MGRALLALLAVACGAAVGTVYFPQAISPAIAADLDVTRAAAATVVTAVQFGYALGIFFLVPLGDRFPARTLLATLFAVTGAALLAASRAPALAPLVLASAVIGVATVAAQVINPLAAGLTTRRGAVLGVLLSGSIAGIVVARGLGGALADAFGWREVYVAAAVLSLAMAVALALAVPAGPAVARRSYGALLLGAIVLLRSEPDLRRSCAYQACVFGAFSAVWTTLALLITGPAYRLGTQAIGLLSLVGIGTMVCAPLAGRLADRRGPDLVNGLTLLGALAAAAVLAGGAAGGTAGMVALVVGLLVLDVSMQASMVANHTRVLVLREDARSRLNTALMTCVYLGGGAGSWLGLRAYALAGWGGVSGLAALLAVLGLVVHFTSRGRRRTRRRRRLRARRRDRESARG